MTARHELWFGRLCRARAAHTWACSIINTLCSLIDHTSHPYNNLGTATAQYSLLPLIGLIPPVLLPILKIIFASFLWQVILSLQKSLSAFFVLHSGIPSWRWLSTCFSNWFLIVILTIRTLLFLQKTSIRILSKLKLYVKNQHNTNYYLCQFLIYKHVINIPRKLIEYWKQWYK